MLVVRVLIVLTLGCAGWIALDRIAVNAHLTCVMCGGLIPDARAWWVRLVHGPLLPLHSEAGPEGQECLRISMARWHPSRSALAAAAWRIEESEAQGRAAYDAARATTATIEYGPPPTREQLQQMRKQREQRGG